MAETKKPAKQEAVEAETERALLAQFEAERPVTAETRRPLGKLTPRLDNTPVPGFHARWINDTENRISDAIAAGYTMMQDRDGKPLSKVVGAKRTGGPLVAYRMKVLLEWWLADRAKIEEGRRAIESEMMRGTHGRGADDGRYLVTRAGQPVNNISTSFGRQK